MYTVYQGKGSRGPSGHFHYAVPLTTGGLIRHMGGQVGKVTWADQIKDIWSGVLKL